MATNVDPTKTPDEIIEDIEAAEENGDIDQILAYLEIGSSKDHRGNGEEDEHYAWTEVTEEALDAFYRLVKAGTDPVGASTALAYLTKIFASLEAWKEEEAIAEVALGCIVSVASKADKTEAGAGEATATEINLQLQLVLDVMKEFDNEATIQEQACLAIEGLALWNEDWKATFRESEGIGDELKAAREERITNERNKAYPVRAAKALGIELEGP
uniref:W2 domain-containing protein n=1 Tax=Pseudo-nitzschia australis TaxID=44445 RepID=A0A7S4EGB1_9STRA|mmetsp:Transcript_68/g.174  ORF Transcript_68/g.174 Transcript_68/m.174 type:complete len:215 (-) Transcript_68:342-986(-)|eukprot:CAMPEP_0168187118 /NCGR_PEP_ID=MMETSP0139_2-20121125/14844_1 /TAXON_ID=44445 /ORGANISM="Pseudo-nitzschia australis, Strain 10249 10 AB" /LENGTH=214 /DNA_ID=CAMNT_0008109269 /DNA_START=82 /DNA_END=726 /DNA_ORIENTATION=+